MFWKRNCDKRKVMKKVNVKVSKLTKKQVRPKCISGNFAKHLETDIYKTPEPTLKLVPAIFYQICISQ